MKSWLQLSVKKRRYRRADNNIARESGRVFHCLPRSLFQYVILEQVRLCLGKKGLCSCDIIEKKIKRDRLIKQGFHDLKLRHCELMTEYNTHKKNMLALANDFLSRFNTPSIQEDPALWKPALERVVLYIALAPYGKDQQQLLNRVYKEPKLQVFYSQ